MSSRYIRPILRSSISGDVGGREKSHTARSRTSRAHIRAHRSGQIDDGRCIDGCLRLEEATGRPNGRGGVQRTLGRAAATSLMSPTPPAGLRRSHRKKIHQPAVKPRLLKMICRRIDMMQHGEAVLCESVFFTFIAACRLRCRAQVRLVALHLQ